MRQVAWCRGLLALTLAVGASGCGDGATDPQGPPPLLRSACEAGGWTAPSTGSLPGVPTTDTVEVAPQTITAPAPQAPPSLRVSASTTLQFILDEEGRVEACSVTVVAESNASWTAAVLTALPQLRTTPALINGQPVRVLAQQRYSFVFEATRRYSTATLRVLGA